MAAVGLQTHIWRNQTFSVLLLLGLPVLLLAMIFAFFAALPLADPSFAQDAPLNAGIEGVLRYGHWAFLAAGIWFVIAWFFHESLISLATGARAVTRTEEPRIYNLLENLCISRGIPMPKLSVMETDALNAFASGLSEKTFRITLTRGIMEQLDDAELEAVIGHELSHILNRDVKLLIISVIFVGMVSFLCEIIFRMLVSGPRVRSGNRKGGGMMMLMAFAILAIGYVFSILIRFALSRRREFLADAGSIELTRNPDAMIAALQKISGRDQVPGITADMKAMMIENASSIFGLFATHPPIEARIAALKALGGRERETSTATSGPWG